MKAKLEFDLPEEEVEFQDAVNGHKWRSVVAEVEHHLHYLVKYEDVEVIGVNTVRKLIAEKMADEGVSDE